MKWKSFKKERPKYKSGKCPLYCITDERGFNVYFARYCHENQEFNLAQVGICFYGPIIVRHWLEMPEIK